MAAIEKEALEYEVVDRLSKLLENTRENEYSTTETLSHFTTILSWTMQRLNGRVEGPLHALRDLLQRTPASDWDLPEPLANDTVFEALKKLRNAVTHAGSHSSAPINLPRGLVGFALGDGRPRDGEPWQCRMEEHLMRRIGLRIAGLFVEYARGGVAK